MPLPTWTEKWIEKALANVPEADRTKAREALERKLQVIADRAGGSSPPQRVKTDSGNQTVFSSPSPKAPAAVGGPILYERGMPSGGGKPFKFPFKTIALVIAAISGFRTVSRMHSAPEAKQPRYSATAGLLHVQYGSGRMVISPSPTDSLKWTCSGLNPSSAPEPTTQDGVTTLDLRAAAGVDCNIGMPKGVPLKIEGVSGLVVISRPKSPIDLRLSNGHVTFEADPTRRYRFETQIKNGRMMGLSSSEASDAIPIQVTLANGMLVAAAPH